MFFSHWLPRRTTKHSVSAKLGCLALEGREVPAAFQIVFDYRYDATGFFSDPTRRADLERAADQYEARINQNVDLAAINPGGGNSWTATTFNPSNTDEYVSISNLSIGADQIVVFVGAEGGVGGGEAGLGGYGGYSASGNQAWFNTLRQRGRSGFAPWGGSVSFSNSTNWHFGTGTPGGSQIDFFTVATHELGHVLGFGVANQFNALVSGGSFNGTNARNAYGGTNPPVDGTGHWQQGITSAGQAVSMQPFVAAGTRVAASQLDLAALADIGWEVSGVNSAVPPSPPAIPPVVPPPALPPVSSIPTSAQSTKTKPIALGGSGTFQVYSMVNGNLQAQGAAVTPFAGFTGSVRTAVGDFNGDGTYDIAVGKGPGKDQEARVLVYDGATGQVVQNFVAFELGFSGGVNLAAGSIQGNGKDSLVVSADRGGGPRLKVYAEANPNYLLADFFGIEDTRFNGGTRVAVGDVNRDGKDDLLVAAGYGGGPRVALFDGRSLTPTTPPTRLVGDFLAYESGVQNGVYVSLADTNGDGFADLIFGPGSGAARVKVVDAKRLIDSGDSNKAMNFLLDDYFVVDPNAGYNGGIRVLADDFDGDGSNDTVIGSGTNESGRFWLRSKFGTSTIAPFGSSKMSDGVFVG